MYDCSGLFYVLENLRFTVKILFLSCMCTGTIPDLCIKVYARVLYLVYPSEYEYCICVSRYVHSYYCICVSRYVYSYCICVSRYVYSYCICVSRNVYSYCIFVSIMCTVTLSVYPLCVQLLYLLDLGMCTVTVTVYLGMCTVTVSVYPLCVQLLYLCI